MNRTYTVVMVLIASAALAGPAMAHTGGAVTGMGAGLAHPFLGLDHMLAMLAVGLWSAAQPRARAWQGPVLFVAVLAIGGLLGLGGVAMPFVELGILTSVSVLGVMILAARVVPAAFGLAAIGGFALLHGHAHGSEAVGAVAGYMAGFMLASVMLHLSGYGLGRMLSQLRYGVPAAGLGIAAAGIALISG